MKSQKLSIGCGRKIEEGFINLDIVELPGVDVVHDLNEYPYPFKDNTFNYILCDSVLEHLNDIIKPIEELHRISKDGAIIRIIVPLAPSVYAFADPTHKSFYTYHTFNYFGGNEFNYYSKVRFNILKRRIIFDLYLRPIEFLVNLCDFNKKLWNRFFYFLIPAMLLDVELEVIK